MDLTHLPNRGGVVVIKTPAEIHSRPDIGVLIQTPDDLLRWHATTLKTHHKPDQWHCETAVFPFVSESRWLFLCEHCNGGVSCGPAWPIGCCFECGAVHDRIFYPDDAADIEAVLLQRQALSSRNWLIGETLERLVLENLGRDVPPGESAGVLRILERLGKGGR